MLDSSISNYNEKTFYFLSFNYDGATFCSPSLDYDETTFYSPIVYCHEATFCFWASKSPTLFSFLPLAIITFNIQKITIKEGDKNCCYLFLLLLKHKEGDITFVAATPPHKKAKKKVMIAIVNFFFISIRPGKEAFHLFRKALRGSSSGALVGLLLSMFF